MTDDEIIAVVQAHKEGKKIQNRYAMQPGEANRYNEWIAIDNPSWNFFNYDYRVAPEPRKPREFWLVEYHWTSQGEPFFRNEPHKEYAIHVREVIDDSEAIKTAFRKALDALK